MQTAFYEVFARINPFTGLFEDWIGTAPLKTAQKYGLVADLRYVLYGDESLCDSGGWACRSQNNYF